MQKKIHFTMVPKYSKGWGLWEGLREVMQNALDSNDLENPMNVRHGEGHLIVENIGAQIGIENFLLGETDKDDVDSLRGKHGEGLTLALMALCRQGIESVVFSGDFSWRPQFEFVESLNGVTIERDLFTLIQEEHTDDPFFGVKVQVKIEEEVWEGYRSRFLPLVEPDIGPDEVFRYGGQAVLFGEGFKGLIYSRGIFVQKKEEFEYGYDMKLELDRDRNTVPDFDLKWNAGCILSMYERQKKANLAYDLVCSKSAETTYINLGVEEKNRFGEAFVEDHGEDAVPVTTDEEANDVRRVGMKPVIVPGKAKEILHDTKVPKASELKRKYSVQVKKKYSMSDLNMEARHSIEKAVGVIQRMIGAMRAEKQSQGERKISDATGVSSEMIQFLLNEEVRFKAVELSDKGASIMVCEDLMEVGVSRKMLTTSTVVVRNLVRGVAQLAYEKRATQSVGWGVEDIWAVIHRFHIA